MKKKTRNRALNHYKKLITLRNRHPVFAEGEFIGLVSDKPDKVMSFVRRDSNETILVVLNFAKTEQTVSLNLSGVLNKDGKFAATQDMLDETIAYPEVSAENASKFSVTIPPYGIRMAMLK